MYNTHSHTRSTLERDNMKDSINQEVSVFPIPLFKLLNSHCCLTLLLCSQPFFSTKISELFRVSMVFSACVCVCVSLFPINSISIHNWKANWTVNTWNTNTIESFFSRYMSNSLHLFFVELKRSYVQPMKWFP